MKKVIISGVLIAFLLCSVSVFARTTGFNYNYGTSSWDKRLINANDYTAFCEESSFSNYFYAARADGNGVDIINFNNVYNGGWGTTRISATIGIAYSVLAEDLYEDGSGPYYHFYAARTGGLDIVDFNGISWSVSSVNSNNYVALCANGDGAASAQIIGARAGGVDYIRYDGGWQTTEISTSSYVAIIDDPVAPSQLYAAKAGGGIDAIVWGGGAWSAVPLTALDGVTYVALAAENPPQQQSRMWGARADGGIDAMWYGNGWERMTIIPTTQYTAIADDSRSNAQLYGCRADGGFDAMSYVDNVGWPVVSLSTAPYDIVFFEAASNNLFAATSSPYDPETCTEAKEFGYSQVYDFSGNCKVDFADFAIFAAKWLDCIDPETVGCDTPWAP